MCGPSQALKDLNSKIKSFADTTASEAQTIFGDASSIFNDLKTSLGAIVKGGPSQQGWGAAESNAVNSMIMDQAATNARNQKAAVGNAIAAIGGGNVAAPSGLALAATLETNQNIEAEKSRQLSQAVIQNYETGRKNYFDAVGQEEALPNVFNSSIEANKVVQAEYKNAIESQKQVDAASNWWQPLVMAGIGAAKTFATGGLSNLGVGESLGEGTKDFFSGGFGALGGK